MLHLDHNGYYGDQMASFSFDKLLEWVEKHRKDSSGDEFDSVEPLVHLDQDLESTKEVIARALAREELKEKHKKEEGVSAVVAGGACGAAGDKGVLENEGGVGEEVVQEERIGTGTGDAAPCPAPAVTPEIESQGEKDLGVSWRCVGGVKENGNGDGVEKGTASVTAAGGGAAAAAAEIFPLENRNYDLEGVTTSPPSVEGDKSEDYDNGNTEKSADETCLQTHKVELQLRLLPLSHHGCRTRAGAPSDSCVQERLREKAAEGNPGYHSRRRVVPSHPAWFGRRTPMKTLGRVGGVDERAGGEEETELHPAFWGYRTKRRPDSAELVRLSRSFNLDLTSQVWSTTCSVWLVVVRGKAV